MDFQQKLGTKLEWGREPDSCCPGPFLPSFDSGLLHDGLKHFRTTCSHLRQSLSSLFGSCLFSSTRFVCICVCALGQAGGSI